MVKTDGIDHVVLYVNNYERSKKFYLDILGLTVHHEERHGERSSGFMNAGPGHLLALFEKGMPGSSEPPRGDGREIMGSSEFNFVSLTTDSGSRESVKAELQSKGVDVHSRSDDPESLYFEDPDGHPIRLHVSQMDYPAHPGTFG